MTKHAAVFIDHSEAKVFHVDDEGFDPAKIEPRHQRDWSLRVNESSRVMICPSDRRVPWSGLQPGRSTPSAWRFLPSKSFGLAITS